ncbi:potassium channel subfamily K member 17-like [Clarias gariepinus]|uniref:potassium channel subfamily K member 17 n=1 Tax=Clarias gariepinus TaxID=13013 RepID=UPI00234CA21D|nr:potassium channel subfamily K member 17 [Clarias gariepinus]
MASIRLKKLFKDFNFRKFLSVLMLGVGYMTYVLLGGVIFWKLEGDEVMTEIVGLQQRKNQMLQIYPCLGESGLQDMGTFIDDISKYGMSLKSNKTAGGFWKFTSSAVFAAAVVTTIGYGNIVPTTIQGRVFCVIFAIFGIPLNMVVLNQVGKYMLAIERNFCTMIAKKTSHQKFVLVSLHFASFIGSGILYLVVPMVFFQQYEDWSLTEGMYYCFITLSTVGFGDFVAAYNPDEAYPVWYGYIIGVWIFFGMAWLALVINHTIELLGKFNAYLNSGKKNAKENTSQEQELEETQEKEPEEKETDEARE